jgi:sterol desaturase/sphingolipid hydroxylase (fatty acid hydroxylase superfamily)
MNRTAQKELQSKILDTVTASIVLGLCYYRPEVFNPWSLNAWKWLLGAVVIRAAITFYDHLVVFVMDFLYRDNLLPTRTTGTPVRFVELDRKSLIFLTINAVHEWIFVQRLCHYIWFSPNVSIDLQDIGIVNTIAALYVMFIVLDICYAPCHHILHMPWCYPLVHKHHHRQHFPTRGYLDAGNEHPIEHLIGILSVWGAVLAAVHGPTGAHGVTLFLFFNIHAALAMLNHSPYNVEVTVGIPVLTVLVQLLRLPYTIISGGSDGDDGCWSRWIMAMMNLKYSVANHEMHHRKFTINYAQYCMWYDHVMNTYAPYEGPTTTTTTTQKEL